MSDNWYLAELVDGDSKTAHHSIVIKHSISVEETENIMDCFEFVGIYSKITMLKDIVIQNGIDFKWNVSPQNIKQQRENKIQPSKIVLNANRVSLNYATSIRTFIDFLEKMIVELTKKDESKYFKELCSNLYDNNLEYRFWYNFRNYIVHYDLPYTVFKANEVNGYYVICLKEHLLQFSNWKHSQHDIENMMDEIDLPAMIDPMGGLIYALYINFFSYFAERIISNVQKFQKYCKDNSINLPIFYNMINKNFEAVNVMKPLPIKELYDMVEVLDSNPNVRINYTK